MKIGCPIVKLKRRGTRPKQGKHGSIAALLREMYETRKTKSQTFDKNRVHLDEFYYPDGCENVEDAICYLENLFEEDWKAKHGDKEMRADRVYGFTGIIKPPAEEIMKMPIEERNRFLTDALHCYCEIAESRNITIDGCAVHRDEDGDHLHLFGHSNDFNVHDFSDLPFKGMLNRELPRMMRERGWDFVEDCKSNRKPGEKKKKHGKDVNTYRRDKIKEQTDELEALKGLLEAQISDLEEKSNNMQEMIAEELKKAYKSKEEELKAKERKLKLWEMSLANEEKAQKEHFEKQQENFGRAVREAAEKLNNTEHQQSARKERVLPRVRGFD